MLRIAIITGGLLLALFLGLFTYSWFNPSLPLHPNIKVWRTDDHTLNWSDFQTSQASASELGHAAYTTASIDAATSFWVMPISWNRWEATPVIKTVAYFVRRASYAEPTLKMGLPHDWNQIALEHEQGHFDLYEAQSRRLQRRLQELRGYGSTPWKAVEDLFLKIKETSTSEQLWGPKGNGEQEAYDHDVYNSESSFLDDPAFYAAQLAWLRRIQDELNDRASPLDATKIQIEGQVIKGQSLAASARAKVILVDANEMKIEGEANPDGSFTLQIPQGFDLVHPITGIQEIRFEDSLVAQPSEAIILRR